MKASELRIGNLVKYKKGHLAKVTGVSSNYEASTGKLIVTKEVINVIGLESNYIDGVFESDNFYGVELTEDFVIDLGLKPVEIENGEWYYQDNKFRLNKNYSGFYYSRNLDVKYVHQLQNLYFALTGEELTIKN